jgi:hypothetical protein
MTKDEALDLALEALSPWMDTDADHTEQHAAYYAIKQALAAPVQEPAGLIARLTNPEQHYEFTDTKKANAVLMSLCQEAADALAAQQEHEPENEPFVSLASVQEPVAWMYELIIDGEVCNVECTNVNWNPEYQPFGRAGIDFVEGGKVTKTPLYTTPPAAPKVVDCHATGVCVQSGLRAEMPAPVQEPVAWQVHPFDYGIGHQGAYARTDRSEQVEMWKRKGWNVQPLYATPPAAQRQWVGLSQDELDAMFSNTIKGKKLVNYVARAIEAKLKEKNT